jgi:serine protease
VDAGRPTGSGRRICVIDSGIHATHEDLQGANIVGGEPSGWNSDGCGHGTHVTGTIAAVNNSIGVVGVAIAPEIYAVAALIWSSDPSKTNDEVRDAMNQSALDLGDAGRANAYGYGLVQAYDAWKLLGGNGTGNVPPIASFTANCANLTCSFDAGASNDPDGSIVSYYWDFGDGASSSGLSPSHVFAAGSFSVTLTVTDDSGATGSLTQAVSAGTSTSDDTPPVISNVTSAKTKGTRFVITWETDEPASSEVIFTCCGSFSDGTLVTSHGISLRGSKGVLYEYVVRSMDAAGNTSTSTKYTYQN